MNVGFFTRGSENKGSTRVRVHQFLAYLPAAGFEYSVVSRSEIPSLVQRAAYLAGACSLSKWADIIFIQKPNQSKLLIDLLCTINPRMVLDVDDAIWISPPSKATPAAIEAKFRFRRRFLHACSRAECVITGSNYLANKIQELGADVRTVVIPPSVDLQVYNRTKDQVTDAPPVIGWIGSPGNFGDLLHILQPLQSVVISGKAKLQIVSSTPPDFDAVPFEFKRWTLDSEVLSLLNFDIGIMPLGNDERSLGRCGYKAIQYMAVGIPVICSSTGAGTEVMDHGVEGFRAGCNQEWLDYLDKLIENPDLRREMGARGRKRVEKLYSVQANFSKLLDVLNQIY